MKSYLKIFMPFLLAVLVGSLTFAFAQKKDDQGQFDGGKHGFPPHDGMRGGGIPPPILEQLNLTDAQKTQLKALREASRTSSQTYFETIKSADEKLRALVDGGTFTEEAARPILNEKAQAMTELELIHLKTDQAVKNILTAEQKAQLETLKKQGPPEGMRGEKHGMPPQDN